MPKKTYRELYDQFCNKFTIDQTARSKELSMLYKFLQRKVKIQNGNYIDYPPYAMRYYIEVNLGFVFTTDTFEKKGPTNAGPLNNNNAGQLIYNLVEGICK